MVSSEPLNYVLYLFSLFALALWKLPKSQSLVFRLVGLPSAPCGCHLVGDDKLFSEFFAGDADVPLLGNVLNGACEVVLLGHVALFDHREPSG